MQVNNPVTLSHTSVLLTSSFCRPVVSTQSLVLSEVRGRMTNIVPCIHYVFTLAKTLQLILEIIRQHTDIC